jgi:hypothetical protein
MFTPSAFIHELWQLNLDVHSFCRSGMLNACELMLTLASYCCCFEIAGLDVRLSVTLVLKK